MPERLLKMESVPCGVCRSTQHREYTTGRDYEYETSPDQFQVVECVACKNLYLNPRPDNTELSTIYPPHYYAYTYDQTIHPLAIKAKDILDKRKVKSWLSYTSGKDLTFLDVGCGNGRYLKMLHSMGYAREKLYGVELSQEQVERLNQEGYKAFYGRIEEVSGQLPQQAFDLIVILQVLEHVDNPSAVVGTLAKLLRPGGLLIIETPNTQSLDLNLFREKYWGGYHFPRHWNLFNCDNLNLMCEASGLKRRAINFLPAHTFWIFSFHHLFADGWQNKFLADLFDPFKNIFLLSIFTGFDIVRAGLGFKTSNVQFIAEKPESN